MSQPKVEIPLEIKDDTDGVSEIPLRKTLASQFLGHLSPRKIPWKRWFRKVL